MGIKNKHLENPFQKIGILRYDSSEIDVLLSNFHEEDTADIYSLLRHLALFLQQFDSNWNIDRSEEQILAIFTQMSNAIEEYQRNISIYNVNDNAVYSDALAYCKAAIENRLMQHNRFTSIYKRNANALKDLMQK